MVAETQSDEGLLEDATEAMLALEFLRSVDASIYLFFFFRGVRGGILSHVLYLDPFCSSVMAHTQLFARPNFRVISLA
jgi:hypothetical protein